MAKPTLVDLTQDLSDNTPFFPGDDQPRISVLETAGGMHPSGRRSLNNSRLETCVHCGTHIDAPFHFFNEGLTIDQVALEACVGPAILLDLRFLQPRQSILPAHLADARERIQKTRRVVLQTGWSKNWGDPKYFTDYPVISEEAAELIVSLGVLMVGVDTPSVDDPPFPAHLALLGNGVLIVENLTNLDRISEERFYFTAAPLKIVGRDASPTRAFAQPFFE